MILPLTLLTGRESLFDLVPRILLRLLEAERDALLFLVDVEDDYFELLTDFHQSRSGCPSRPQVMSVM